MKRLNRSIVSSERAWLDVFDTLIHIYSNSGFVVAAPWPSKIHSNST